jgi:predicted enzyme related to lactoylglutathione lyase
MEVRRIVPNINSNKLEDSKIFYTEFLGLNLVMDMKWVLTFASTSNPTAQITLVESKDIENSNSTITLSIEVSEIDKLYEKAKLFNFEMTYEITNEPWGVRRFFVKDPNGVTINLITHI